MKIAILFTILSVLVPFSVFAIEPVTPTSPPNPSQLPHTPSQIMFLREWILYVDEGREIDRDLGRYGLENASFLVEISSTTQHPDGNISFSGLLPNYDYTTVGGFINVETGTAWLDAYIFFYPVIRKEERNSPSFVFEVHLDGFTYPGGIEGTMEAEFSQITNTGEWVSEVKYHGDAGLYRYGKGQKAE